VCGILQYIATQVARLNVRRYESLAVSVSGLSNRSLRSGTHRQLCRGRPSPVRSCTSFRLRNFAQRTRSTYPLSTSTVPRTCSCRKTACNEAAECACHFPLTCRRIPRLASPGSLQWSSRRARALPRPVSFPSSFCSSSRRTGRSALPCTRVAERRRMDYCQPRRHVDRELYPRLGAA